MKKIWIRNGVFRTISTNAPIGRLNQRGRIRSASTAAMEITSAHAIAMIDIASVATHPQSSSWALAQIEEKSNL